jgi:NADPH:quinone reductase-like Zn-dependent oxidoreductase
MTVRKEYAVTITARERAELLAVEPDAKPLAPDEVAGRTLATLVSPGTELATGFQGERFPSHPGYASAFQVERLGNDVKDIAVGGAVFCMGSHRSFQRVDRKGVVPIPKGLAPSAAVFVRWMGVSMSTQATTKARPPETILVTGLGLVGNLAAQIFAATVFTATTKARCAGWPRDACESRNSVWRSRRARLSKPIRIFCTIVVTDSRCC